MVKLNELNKKEYYVVFSFYNKFGIMNNGSTSISCNKAIETYDDIDFVRKQIEESIIERNEIMKGSHVVILNWKELII